ncbi:MAG: tetratricopeptide repeat protein, partial [Vicinamibacteria bacterium]
MRIARPLVIGAALGGAALVSLALAQGTSDEAALADELERAKSLFIHGSFPQAAAALGAIVAKLEREGGGSEARTMLADAHFHLGLTYFALNASDSAKESFKEVARLDPRFRVDPARYAPRIVELYEQAREESEGESREPADSGEAAPAEESNAEERSSRAERILVGAAGAGAGATLGALTAGGNETVPNASTPQDDDGDGFAAADGDCNDRDPRIHPEGDAALRVSFAFTGTVACRTANPRQQIYEIVNNSCLPFSVLGLERSVTTIDSLGRRTASLRTSLPVDVNFVAPATTAVIRIGSPAGTAEALCRDLSLSNPFSRPKGDLRVDETYVVETAGASELSTSNSFLVLDTAECSFCNLDSIFGPYAARSPAFRWQSELNVRGGSARLLLDSERALEVGPGPTS